MRPAWARCTEPREEILLAPLGRSLNEFEVSRSALVPDQDRVRKSTSKASVVGLNVRKRDLPCWLPNLSLA